MAIKAVWAMIWMAIFTLGSAYLFSKAGVVASPESWAAAVVHGVWGYGVYWAVGSLISRLERLAFSRRLLVYVALIALMLLSVVVYTSFVRFLNAEA